MRAQFQREMTFFRVEDPLGPIYNKMQQGIISKEFYSIFYYGNGVPKGEHYVQMSQLRRKSEV